MRIKAFYKDYFNIENNSLFLKKEKFLKEISVLKKEKKEENFINNYFFSLLEDVINNNLNLKESKNFIEQLFNEFSHIIDSSKKILENEIERENLVTFKCSIFEENHFQKIDEIKMDEEMENSLFFNNFENFTEELNFLEELKELEMKQEIQSHEKKFEEKDDFNKEPIIFPNYDVFNDEFKEIEFEKEEEEIEKKLTNRISNEVDVYLIEKKNAEELLVKKIEKMKEKFEILRKFNNFEVIKKEDLDENFESILNEEMDVIEYSNKIEDFSLEKFDENDFFFQNEKILCDLNNNDFYELEKINLIEEFESKEIDQEESKSFLFEEEKILKLKEKLFEESYYLTDIAKIFEYPKNLEKVELKESQKENFKEIFENEQFKPYLCYEIDLKFISESNISQSLRKDIEKYDLTKKTIVIDVLEFDYFFDLEKLRMKDLEIIGGFFLNPKRRSHVLDTNTLDFIKEKEEKKFREKTNEKFISTLKKENYQENFRNYFNFIERELPSLEKFDEFEYKNQTEKLKKMNDSNEKNVQEKQESEIKEEKLKNEKKKIEKDLKRKSIELEKEEEIIEDNLENFIQLNKKEIESIFGKNKKRKTNSIFPLFLNISKFQEFIFNLIGNYNSLIILPSSISRNEISKLFLFKQIKNQSQNFMFFVSDEKSLKYSYKYHSNFLKGITDIETILINKNNFSFISSYLNSKKKFENLKIFFISVEIGELFFQKFSDLIKNCSLLIFDLKIIYSDEIFLNLIFKISKEINKITKLIGQTLIFTEIIPISNNLLKKFIENSNIKQIVFQRTDQEKKFDFKLNSKSVYFFNIFIKDSIIDKFLSFLRDISKLVTSKFGNNLNLLELETNNIECFNLEDISNSFNKSISTLGNRLKKNEENEENFNLKEERKEIKILITIHTLTYLFHLIKENGFNVGLEFLSIIKKNEYYNRVLNKVLDLLLKKIKNLEKIDEMNMIHPKILFTFQKIEDILKIIEFGNKIIVLIKFSELLNDFLNFFFKKYKNSKKIDVLAFDKKNNLFSFSKNEFINFLENLKFGKQQNELYILTYKDLDIIKNNCTNFNFIIEYDNSSLPSIFQEKVSKQLINQIIIQTSIQNNVDFDKISNKIIQNLKKNSLNKSKIIQKNSEIMNDGNEQIKKKKEFEFNFIKIDDEIEFQENYENNLVKVENIDFDRKYYLEKKEYDEIVAFLKSQNINFLSNEKKKDEKKKKIIITENLIQNQELIHSLERRYDFKIYEKNCPIYSQCEILVSQNQSIIFLLLNDFILSEKKNENTKEDQKEEFELNEEFLDDLKEKIFFLKLQFESINLILEFDINQNFAFFNLIDNLSNLATYIDSLSNLFEINLWFSFNFDETVDIINSIYLSNSTIKEINVREDESNEEIILSQFPCLNLFDVQILLEKFCLEKICYMSLKEILKNFEQKISKKKIFDFFNLLHQKSSFSIDSSEINEKNEENLIENQKVSRSYDNVENEFENFLE